MPTYKNLTVDFFSELKVQQHNLMYVRLKVTVRLSLHLEDKKLGVTDVGRTTLASNTLWTTAKSPADKITIKTLPIHSFLVFLKLLAVLYCIGT